MIRHIFSILFASLCLTSHAQVINVESITLQPNDLEARTNPRQDNNGVDCALLKIIIPSLKDMTFDGWIMGDVSYVPGEYKVYVPAGTKKIKFRHEKYLPGDIAFDIPIESKCVYEVVLQVPNEKGKGWVTFRLGQGSEVSVDGTKYKSPSNGILKVQLPYGNHSYQIDAKGCESKNGVVKISKEPEYVDGVLTGTCEVTIVARSGTQLTINGVKKGVLFGTSKIHLPEGKFTFKGIFNGVERTQTIKIKNGQTSVTVKL